MSYQLWFRDFGKMVKYWFWDFGKQSGFGVLGFWEKSGNQKKSEKIGENQGNQNPVQNPIARESDSVQEPGHQIRKNQIKSE